MTKKEQSSGTRGHFFHVTHDKANNKWHVKEVKAKNHDTYDSKEEALKAAEEKAKKIESGHVVVHREDGTFETRETPA